MAPKPLNAVASLALAIGALALVTGCAAGTAREYKPTVKPVAARKAVPAEKGAQGIVWGEWGKAAFDRAATEDKLVFLDISASWCHWCMVMEETTYADPRVAELINSEFVPVYVDTDQRPDINDLYNQGGWPSIAVLTPKGQALSGTTTVSADELLVLLQTVNAAYREDREAVHARLAAREKAAEEAKSEREKEKKESPLSAQIPVSVLRAVNLFVDPEFGGYGGPDKYPMPEVERFALALYPKVKDNAEYSPKKAVTLTLDKMAEGILDKVEGGFFRYSTSVDWKSPHYEKLLSTNGDLLGVYMQAYRTLGTDRYRQVGESVAGYMEGTLADPATGAFFNSQAADERYYRLGYDARVAMGAPPVSADILADSNARAALGYLEAYRATGDPHYLLVARRVVDYIMSSLTDANEYGVRHSATSGPGVLLLSDQVYAALAADYLYQATGEPRYLEFAAGVAGGMAERFWDKEEAGFYNVWYAPSSAMPPGARNKPQIENSAAASLMADLYHITGTMAYKDTAKHTLMPYTADYAKYSFWAAPFALAVTRCTETAYEFIVLGPTADPGTRDLVKKAFMFENPDRVVVALDPVRDRLRVEKLGYEYEGKPILYVCSERACFPPVSPGESLDTTRKSIEKAAHPATD